VRGGIHQCADEQHTEFHRQTKTRPWQEAIDSKKCASVPRSAGTLGTLARCVSVPVCHTRKGGARHARSQTRRRTENLKPNLKTFAQKFSERKSGPVGLGQHPHPRGGRW
jgi:hypothetical protein